MQGCFASPLDYTHREGLARACAQFFTISNFTPENFRIQLDNNEVVGLFCCYMDIVMGVLWM